MILESGTTLVANLQAAVAANQLQISASYADHSRTNAQFLPAAQYALTNGTARVSVVSMPSSNTQRQVKHFSVYNADTSTATISISKLVSDVSYIVIVKGILPGNQLEYGSQTGWHSKNSGGGEEVFTNFVSVSTTNVLGYSSGTSFTKTSNLSFTVGSSNVTMDLAAKGTAGSYAYVTTDAWGQVTAGSASLSTTSLSGSITTGMIVGSWTTNSIVGTWTSDVSSSNISVNNEYIADGTNLAPSIAFKSERSLGLFRSGVSNIGVSYGQFEFTDGTAVQPSTAFSSESSLGWYKSGSSVMALSYGTLQTFNLFATGESTFSSAVRIGLRAGISEPPSHALFINSTITSPNSSHAMFGVDCEPIFASTCTGTSATYYLQSVTSISGITFWDLNGLVIDSLNIGIGSSVSTYCGIRILAQTGGATNYAIFTNAGRVRFGDNVWCTSGISVGSSANTGSLIPAISSLSSKVAAFVVQGSASSFTIILWPAAQVGDVILTTVYQGTGVSSMSSGLIAHSHCTKAGQIEFRLSNVSTLVQNQSGQSWAFTRITPF